VTARLALLVAAALALAGCLGDAPASAAPTPTRVPDPTPVTTSYHVGGTVWYEGVLIHVDDVTSILDARGGPVEVNVRVENPGVDPAELQAKIFLRVDDTLVEPTRESRVPPIPAEGSVSAVMTYELQGVTSVEAAGVQVGGAPEHTAYLPLTAAGGAAVTLEPRELPFAGEGAARDLEIRVRGGLQRWDLPDWSEELPATRQAITVYYDATFTGGFTGGFAFTDENVALRLADGTNVPPRADGHSQSIELIGPGRTKRGLFSRFEIPAGVVGTISLVVKDGPKEHLIPLVIPA